jgi:hypothetical protein
MKEEQGKARKGKNMAAVCFSSSSIKHTRPQSSFYDLDGLFACSYKAKKNCNVMF